MLLTDTEVHTAQISYRGWGQVCVQVCVCCCNWVSCCNWVQSLGLWWVSPWMFFRTPLQSEKRSVFIQLQTYLSWTPCLSNVSKCPFMLNVLKWAQDHHTASHASFDVLVNHHWWRDWGDNTGPHCKEYVTHLTVHDQLHDNKLGRLFTSVCDLEVSPTLVVPFSTAGTALIWM